MYLQSPLRRLNAIEKLEGKKFYYCETIIIEMKTTTMMLLLTDTHQSILDGFNIIDLIFRMISFVSSFSFFSFYLDFGDDFLCSSVERFSHVYQIPTRVCTVCDKRLDIDFDNLIS